MGRRSHAYDWWGRRDSNPHELPHTPLKRARLPVPPLPLGGISTAWRHGCQPKTEPRAEPRATTGEPRCESREWRGVREVVFGLRSRDASAMIAKTSPEEGEARMWGSRGVAVAGILGCLLAGCATVSIQETRVVTGRVTDEAGKPVASSPVVVVARSLDLAAMRFEYEERGRQGDQDLHRRGGAVPDRVRAGAGREQLLPVLL